MFNCSGQPQCICPFRRCLVAEAELQKTEFCLDFGSLVNFFHSLAINNSCNAVLSCSAPFPHTAMEMCMFSSFLCVHILFIPIDVIPQALLQCKLIQRRKTINKKEGKLVNQLKKLQHPHSNDAKVSGVQLNLVS